MKWDGALAQDVDRWQAVVNRVMNHKMQGIF